MHILVHPYFDHFAACVFLDALRLAERAHFWHDTHDVPPRVNEVFPPVAGARGARGPRRAQLGKAVKRARAEGADVAGVAGVFEPSGAPRGTPRRA